MKKSVFTILSILLVAIASMSQNSSKKRNNESIESRYFISTSLWSLSNFGQEPADFYELNFGYRLTPKDALILNTTIWKYWEPLGIPYCNGKKNNHMDDYPGFVQAYGVGLVYQRYICNHFFTAAHVNTFLQKFYNEQKNKMQNGFQLYLQFRLGYQWKIFNERFFLEPSVSFNYWPVNTNFPASFLLLENKWPNYFLFEPHLNFGINF